MAEMVLIFGTDTCPHTTSARHSGGWGGHRRLRRHVRGLIPYRQVADGSDS